ncbi:MAG: right-handed parallel beta-helix repeat-containing protein [Candidatus Neomarinimicrobiota bacterium]
MIGVSFAGAEVLYVDKNISDGFWQDSYSELNAALSEAREGDEIWVATGTYFPGGDRNGSFVLKAGIKTYGGFFGGETSRKDRDWVKNPTILSGDIGVIGDYLDNSKHIVCYDGVLDKETVLDGFIIRDGYADNGSNGAGMHLTGGAEPGILNCHFVNNISSGAGGAVYTENGPLFERCLFEGNRAENGAAIYIPENNKQAGIPEIRRCTFVQNTARDGAALYISKHAGVFVDSSLFWQNRDFSGISKTLYLDNRGKGSSSFQNSAIDEAGISPGFQTNTVIYYQSHSAYGPFKDTVNYQIDKKSGIPQDYGWYYVPSPMVLNIRVFMEGPM